MKNCSICHAPTRLLGKGLVLGRHEAEFFQCQSCGFVQVANPHWLKESYASAIAATDIGYASRCVATVAATRLVYGHLFPRGARFLDYGGGYGLFTRMMRDCGFDFRSYDLYCDPIFAKGFTLEKLEGMSFDAVTSFEVFEHLEDPVQELKQIFSMTRSVLFTTLLLPDPTPPVNRWWYYGLYHGQHIAFYTRKAFEHLAARENLHFYTNGLDLHFLTSHRISPLLFRLCTQPRIVKALSLLYRPPSLRESDHEQLVAAQSRSLAAQSPPSTSV